MLKKLSTTVKIWIVLLEILVVLLVFALAYNFFLPIGKNGRVVHFDEKNITSVLESLSQNGYNITDWDHLLIKQSTLPKKGWYRIGHTDEGRYHFFAKLSAHPLETMNIKVYAGETHAELLHRLANDMKLDEKKLTQIYYALATFKEADIFAGTYEIAREADENTTLSYLFHTSQQKLKHFFDAHYYNKPDSYTLKLLLTIASIIQKESNDPKEMPLISSVIYNRLKRDMKLQMDGTLNYGKFSHTIVTPERIKTDNSFYNTYKYKGLPPEPLATVSLAALEAALFPAKSDYLFFMLDKNGGHRFAATYEEHLKNLKAFRQYQQSRQASVAKDANRTQTTAKK
ncbi:MAG: endolytic transglycosylase MltG [Sulfurovum sp.]|nr:endolytic transglycosylase MltG [Sulfurovum sp.]